jgi:hypothetical protein
MLKFTNTEEISHLSDPAGQELRLKERETGNGRIRGTEETADTIESAGTAFR